MKCSLNGLGSSSLKNSFINNVFCKTILSGSFIIFKFLYMTLKEAVSGMKLIILSDFFWSSQSFAKWSELDCPQVWLAYIKCELKSE